MECFDCKESYTPLSACISGISKKTCEGKLWASAKNEYRYCTWLRQEGYNGTSDCVGCF